MIAVLADTHMPKGSRRLPQRCVELIGEAEATIHAGDFFGVSALEEIATLCPVVHAVHGNVDEPGLRRSLPPALEGVEVGGRTVAVVRDAGPAQGRLARLRRRFPKADAVVFGHSHPLHEEEGGFQIFNPDGPTERRRTPRPSMGLLTCGKRGLVFEHVWL